jgi:hypothetical protein
MKKISTALLAALCVAPSFVMADMTNQNSTVTDTPAANGGTQNESLPENTKREDVTTQTTKTEKKSYRKQKKDKSAKDVKTEDPSIHTETHSTETSMDKVTTPK